MTKRRKSGLVDHRAPSLWPRGMAWRGGTFSGMGKEKVQGKDRRVKRVSKNERIKSKKRIREATATHLESFTTFLKSHNRDIC